MTVLGLTFKENCPDLRNSRVEDILHELGEYGCTVQVHDPLAAPAEAREEYGVSLVPWGALAPAQAVILAVPHEAYLERGVDLMADCLADGGVVVDVKGVLDRDAVAERGIELWRL